MGARQLRLGPGSPSPCRRKERSPSPARRRSGGTPWRWSRSRRCIHRCWDLPARVVFPGSAMARPPGRRRPWLQGRGANRRRGSSVSRLLRRVGQGRRGTPRRPTRSTAAGPSAACPPPARTLPSGRAPPAALRGCSGQPPGRWSRAPRQRARPRGSPRPRPPRSGRWRPDARGVARGGRPSPQPTPRGGASGTSGW